jgi:hypothetical protein
MKKLLVTLAAVIVTVSSAFAQGTVIFDNRPGSGDAPITLEDLATGAGSITGMKAELALVSGSGATATYTPVGTTTFRGTSGALAKFITSVETAVAGVPAGGTATLVVQAYNGSSYDASLGAGLYRGRSAQFTVQGLGGTPPTGGPALPSPDLSGLQSFFVTTVPEPATIALGVLGAAALLLRRRK